MGGQSWTWAESLVWTRWEAGCYSVAAGVLTMMGRGDRQTDRQTDRGKNRRKLEDEDDDDGSPGEGRG